MSPILLSRFLEKLIRQIIIKFLEGVKLQDTAISLLKNGKLD